MSRSTWLGFSVAVTVALSNVSANAGLLGHWTFDANGNDSSGNGYHATLNGGAVIDTSDKVVGGGALRLPESGDNYAEVTGSDVPSHPLDLAGTSYTIAFWFKPTVTENDNYRIITKDDGNDVTGGYSILHDAGGSTITHSTGSSNNSISNTFSVVQNEWRHVALVFDVNSLTLTTYDNGSPGTPLGVDGALTSDGDDPLWFGGMPVHGQFYRGLIDDIWIYDNVLDQGDVVALMNGGNGAVPEPTSLALLAMGLIGLIGLVRRGRKS